ncbi:MAG: thiamine phosphate synthase, partial [Chloroflexota bacterium]
MRMEGETAKTPRGLYVITDRRLSLGRTDEAVVAASLRGGARVVQMREKGLPRAEALDLARRLGALCHTQGAIFIVNDDPLLAAEAGADGVHLGPEDGTPEH